MFIEEFEFFDPERLRQIPVMLYLPEDISGILPVVIFNPGYQEQKDLARPKRILANKKWGYLAEYFTNKGYAFISIQNEILGDRDGLEYIDKNIPQVLARKHLWMRGEQNILFVINEMKLKYPSLNFDEFIIAGHSNGGDIAKFFANNHEDMISSAIIFDGRRCPIDPFKKLKLLMFEADDTSTDIGVIPGEGTQTDPKRENLEWVIIKPKGAKHVSYRGDMITEELKKKIFNSIDFFLKI